MIWTSGFCCATTSNTGGSGTDLSTLIFAANDLDATLRGVAVGGFYKASGPVSSEDSLANGGTLQPNTLGIKEGTITQNMGYI